MSYMMLQSHVQCMDLGEKKRKKSFFFLIEEDMKKEKNIEPQKLDLKPLLVELKYAYLEENDQCSVVISSLLNPSHEDSLLDVLKKNRQAIGWKI